MAKRPPLEIGKYRIGKECGGKWFPGIGYGYWDGWQYYIFHQKPKINLKFRRFQGGFAIGPLMFWDETKSAPVKPVVWNPKFDPTYLDRTLSTFIKDELKIDLLPWQEKYLDHEYASLKKKRESHDGREQGLASNS